MTTLIRNRLQKRRAGHGFSYLLPETNSFVNRFTTAPTPERLLLINQTMTRLRDTVAFTKLDYLRLWAAADFQAGSLNWLNSLYTGTNTGTFTTDRGVAGDGVATYADEVYAPNSGVGGPYKYVRNSNFFAAWSLTSGQTSGSDVSMTASTVTTLAFRTAANILAGRPNQTAATTAASTDGRGMLSAARDGANTARISKNGVLVASSVEASVALPVTAFSLGRAGSVYNTRTFAGSMAGQYLTEAEELAIYNAILPYLVAVGAVT